MKTSIVTQVENIDIKEVRLVHKDEEANKLLAEGWILITAGVSHTDKAGCQPKPHYILAKVIKGKYYA